LYKEEEEEEENLSEPSHRCERTDLMMDDEERTAMELLDLLE
jgi:hypothetical protein